MLIQNDKPTFFRPGMTTCIDHIINNCQHKLTNITTYNKHYSNTTNTNFHNSTSSDYSDNNSTESDCETNYIMSDHSIISAIYNDSQIEVPQLFTIFRNEKLLTKQRLIEEFKHN